MERDKKLNTEVITAELIQYIINKIVQEIHPIKIILFGSYARDEFNHESDLDLFIIIDNIKESSRLVRRKIDALLRGRKFAVDLFVRKETEVDWNLKADNSFYTHHILKDGKVLYERS